MTLEGETPKENDLPKENEGAGRQVFVGGGVGKGKAGGGHQLKNLERGHQPLL